MYLFTYKTYAQYALACVILLFFLFSCKKDIRYKRFNPYAFQADINGCDGTRRVQIVYLDSIKDDFKGMWESQLLEILGRPNKQELDERNKKSYVYHFAPGKQCMFGTGEVRSVVVDFDGLNRVERISYRVEP